MNYPLFFILIGTMSVLSLWLGKKASQKTKTLSDYFLMNRNLKLFGLSMTFLATQLGGGSLLGASEEAYSKGWSVFFYPLGISLGLLILGLGYGAKMRKLHLTTVAEIFEKVYGSIKLRKFASLISIASLFFILIGQAIASRKFFASLGLDSQYLFIAFWLVLVLYTVMGGLKAVVNTDMLQAGFIIIALGVVFVGSLQSPENTLLPAASLQKTSSAPWLNWLLMPLLFMLIEQDMGQRCFAAKNGRTVTLAALIAAFFLFFVSFVPIYFGCAAAKYGIQIPADSSVFITSVKALAGPTLSTILIAAILMAIVSTADSLLCSISSNLSCDFLTKKANEPSDLEDNPNDSLEKQEDTSSREERKKLGLAQGATFILGISTLALSYFFENVVNMLMFSYEFAVSTLLVPVTMAIFKKNPSKRSAIISMVVGMLGLLLLNKFAIPFPKAAVIVCFAFLSFALSEKFKKRRTIKDKSSQTA